MTTAELKESITVAFQLVTPQMVVDMSCGVDNVTEPTKGHQMAHVRKPGITKRQSFPFR
jgi:hypothetical protein